MRCAKSREIVSALRTLLRRWSSKASGYSPELLEALSNGLTRPFEPREEVTDDQRDPAHIGFQ